jgi:hypothetical protein
MMALCSYCLCAQEQGARNSNTLAVSVPPPDRIVVLEGGDDHGARHCLPSEPNVQETRVANLRVRSRAEKIFARREDDNDITPKRGYV